LGTSTEGAGDVTESIEPLPAETGGGEQGAPAPHAAIAALTRTGAVAGTPAYMAPEQFLGRSIDARTDQFAFCVAIYEALYGERPFGGDTVLALAGAVTAGRMKEVPKEADVPGWVRKIVQRGLLPDPAARHADFDRLLAALGKDPVAQTRRRAAVGVALLAVVASIWIVHHRSEQRKTELEREIAGRIAEAENAHNQAAAETAKASRLRAQAMEAFDASRRQEGERVWGEVRRLFSEAEHAWERAERALQATYDLDRQHVGVREKLSSVLYERMLFDELRFRRPSAADQLDRLKALNAGGRYLRLWNEPGSIALLTTPEPATVSIQKATADAAGAISYVAQGDPKPTPLSRPLEPGSYRLVIDSPGRAPVVYPILVGRGQKIALSLTLPAAGAIPAGFVFVPEGDSFFGDYDEGLRTSFLDTVPIHSVHVKAYAIARNETSVSEWLAFLESAEGRGREDYVPAGRDPSAGSVRLLRQKKGRGWVYAYTPWSRSYRVPKGVPIKYAARTRNAVHDWGRLPVTGVSPRVVEDFAAWLRKTGRAPGARLCTEYEWERAARGADPRIYPHGDSLAPSDANFDETHAHNPDMFGLDMVGSHPASDSPFGVSDLAGNAIEIARSSLGPEEFVIRGGSYYQDARTARATNRAVVTSVTRGQSVGFRLCADVGRVGER
jgi:formylglycine-generating enzyme required for sulfatase activity